jgi:hypothetical protein
MNKTSRFLKTFRFHTLLTLGALALEFVLGMYTALFVEFPDTLVNGEAWGWSMKQSPIIIAHILLGTLLVLMALSTLGFGFASRDKAAIIWSAAGLILIGVAYLGGSVFLSKVTENSYSFIMALGFMGSLLTYGAAFYFTRPAETA